MRTLMPLWLLPFLLAILALLTAGWIERVPVEGSASLSTDAKALAGGPIGPCIDLSGSSGGLALPVSGSAAEGARASSLAHAEVKPAAGP